MSPDKYCLSRRLSLLLCAPFTFKHHYTATAAAEEEESEEGKDHIGTVGVKWAVPVLAVSAAEDGNSEAMNEARWKIIHILVLFQCLEHLSL